MSTTRFTWATAGTSTLPDLAKRLIGWLFQEPPAYDLMNWLFQHLAELTGTAGKYDTLEEATADLSIDDTCIVDEYDLKSNPGSESASTTPNEGIIGNADFGSIDVTALRVVCSESADSDKVYSIPRDLDWSTGPDLIQYLRTNAGVNRRIASDGVIVVLAYGNFIEAFDHDTAASLWVYDHTAQVNSVAIGGTAVYLAGIADGGGNTHRALNRTTGAAVWSQAHGAALESVATDGDQVYVGGAAGGGGAELRALNPATGAPNWSTAALVAGVTWYHNIASDGRRLYVAANTTLYILDRENGAVIQNRLLTDVILGIAVTGTSAVGVDDDVVLQIDKTNLDVTVWREQKTTGGVQATNRAVASDGAGVFVAMDANGAAGNTVSRLVRSNRPQVWRRVNTTHNFLPYRQLMIPEE
jgi:outer membrane protein assembly factor BamB